MGRREKNRVKILAKAQKKRLFRRKIRPDAEKPPRLCPGGFPVFLFHVQYRPVQSDKSSTGSTHSSKNASRVSGVIRLYFPKNAM